LAKIIGHLNSSQKNTQFQKINQQKQSLESEVINILNLAIFQGFSEQSRVIYREGKHWEENQIMYRCKKG
jgi:hypothetical protein